jgi:hypothetical protein
MIGSTDNHWKGSVAERFFSVIILTVGGIFFSLKAEIL